MSQKELQEIEVIQVFLPKQLSQDELNNLVDAAIQKLGATGPQDMGKVMGVLSGQTKGKVEGKVLADAVKSKLMS